MYELADWGRPVAVDDLAQRERIVTHLPHTLVRLLRSRARAHGLSLDALIDRLLTDAMSPASHEQAQHAIAAVD